MKLNSKKSWIAACVILLIVFSGAVFMSSYLNNIRHINIFTPELSSLDDGDYKGEYTLTPVEVEVMVSIKSNQISDIEILKHFNGLGKQAEAIIPLIIDKQSLNVEIISGATVSSKCILKAIENALAREITNE